MELGLPSLWTLVGLHNAKFRHSLHVSSSTNVLISYMFWVGAMQCAVCSVGP